MKMRDEAQNLVCIKKKHKNDKYDAKILSIKAKIEESHSHIKSIILGLSLGNRECLIAVLWISKTRREFHHLHSKLLRMDIKHRVNKEKRPLHRTCSRNIVGCDFPPINCF